MIEQDLKTLMANRRFASPEKRIELEKTYKALAAYSADVPDANFSDPKFRLLASDYSNAAVAATISHERGLTKLA